MLMRNAVQTAKAICARPGPFCSQTKVFGSLDGAGAIGMGMVIVPGNGSDGRIGSRVPNNHVNKLHDREFAYRTNVECV